MKTIVNKTILNVLMINILWLAAYITGEWIAQGTTHFNFSAIKFILTGIVTAFIFINLKIMRAVLSAAWEKG